MNLAALLDNLEMGGCHPRQVAPGVWVSWCPTCRLAGRDRVLVSRAERVTCEGDHEAPADERRAAA